MGPCRLAAAAAALCAALLAGGGDASRFAGPRPTAPAAASIDPVADDPPSSPRHAGLRSRAGRPQRLPRALGLVWLGISHASGQGLKLLGVDDVVRDLDRNGDRLIDKWEFMEAVKVAIDNDPDLDHRTGYMWFDTLFERADTDHDGSLTAYEAEFLEHLARNEVFSAFNNMLDHCIEIYEIVDGGDRSEFAVASMLMELSKRCKTTMRTADIVKVATDIVSGDTAYARISGSILPWLKQLVEMSDLDHDGFVDPTELDFMLFLAAEALEAIRQEAHEAEYYDSGEGGEEMGEDEAWHLEAAVQGTLAELDEDADGLVNRDEFLAASADVDPTGAAMERAVSLFSMADANRDGVLDHLELASLVRLVWDDASASPR